MMLDAKNKKINKFNVNLKKIGMTIDFEINAFRFFNTDSSAEETARS